MLLSCSLLNLSKEILCKTGRHLCVICLFQRKMTLKMSAANLDMSVTRVIGTSALHCLNQIIFKPSHVKVTIRHSVSNLVTMIFAQIWRQPSLPLTSPKASVLVCTIESLYILNCMWCRDDFIVFNACAVFCPTDYLKASEINQTAPTELPAEIKPELPTNCTDLTFNYTCWGKWKD